MKQTNRCPKCSSVDIAADAMVVDRAHGNFQSDLTVSTFREPKAWVLKGQTFSKVSAWVCLDCGYLEFYADTPKALRVTASSPT